MADDVASTSSKQFFLQALPFLMLRSSLECEQDPNGILARTTAHKKTSSGHAGIIVLHRLTPIVDLKVSNVA